jgi:hypothetical protein
VGLVRGLLLLILCAPVSLLAGPRVSFDSTTPRFAGASEPIRLEVQADAPVHAFASSGELRRVSGAPGQFEWVPPEAKTPSTGVLVFVGEQLEEPTVVSIPLLGRTELEIDTEPGAVVRVELGKRSFGPRTANPRGKVKVPIEVPPGTSQVQVVAQTQGTSTSRALPLELPPDPALAVGFAAPKFVRGKDVLLLVAHAREVKPEQLDVGTSVGPALLHRHRSEVTIYRLRPEQAGPVSATVKQVGRDTPSWVASAEVVAPTPGQAGAGAEHADADTQPVALGPLRFVAHTQLGYFLGGGESGLELELGAGVETVFLDGRLAIGLEPGLRVTSYAEDDVLELGASTATIYAFPLEPTVRFRVLKARPFGIDALAGGGLVPLVQVVSSQNEPTFSETALSWEAFAGGDLTFGLPQLELTAGVRFIVGGSPSTRVEVPLTRAVGTVGARFRIP